MFVAHGVERRRRWRVRPHWRTVEARLVGTVSIPGSTANGFGLRSTSYHVTRFAYEYRVGDLLHTAYLEQAPPRRVRGSRRARLTVRYDPEAPERVVPDGHVEWSAPLSLAVGAACLLVAGWIACSVAWMAWAR